MERTEPQTAPPAEDPLAAPSPSPPLSQAPPAIAPAPADPGPAPWPRATKWIIGVLAAVALGLTAIVSVGLAAIVWGPLLFALGVTLLMVASARRRRQAVERRGPDEVKDPTRADRPWPTEGVIDDRLPEP